MNFTRAFKYVFEDKDWLSKVGIGLLIMIVPVLNLAWIGYQVQIIRNVRKNEAVVLPTWDDLGKKFMDGLMIVLAGMVYALPIILVALLPLTFLLVPALASSDQDLFSALMAGSTFVVFCLSCGIILYALALSVLTPIMQIHFAEAGTFASCFKVREFFAVLRKHASTFLTLWLVSLGIAIAVSMATSFVTGFIGWVPLLGQLLAVIIGLAGSAYTVYFSSHLYGQFAALVFDANSSGL